jgi:hypothetical protein
LGGKEDDGWLFRFFSRMRTPFFVEREITFSSSSEFYSCLGKLKDISRGEKQKTNEKKNHSKLLRNKFLSIVFFP